MRIAGDSSAILLTALNSMQVAQQEALQKILTGKRISTAGDDPEGMAAWITLRDTAAQDDEFLQSISALTAVLQTADSALNSVVTGFERAVGLGVRGATSTLSQTDREQIATEVSGILKNTVELANTSFRGTYLFAGTYNQQKPFVADEQVPGGWAYAGNSRTCEAEIGGGRSIQMNVAGDQIFMEDGANVLTSLSSLVEKLTAGDTDAIADATNDLRKALDHVTARRVFYGNAMSVLESQTAAVKAEQLELATRENEIAGADQAESITRFLNAQTAREAVLSAAGRMSHLSLLDYLR